MTQSLTAPFFFFLIMPNYAAERACYLPLCFISKFWTLSVSKGILQLSFSTLFPHPTPLSWFCLAFKRKGSENKGLPSVPERYYLQVLVAQLV
jgi:hypothetical protein